MRVNNEQVVFNISRQWNVQNQQMAVLQSITLEIQFLKFKKEANHPLERAIVSEDSMEEDEEITKFIAWLDNQPSNSEDSSQVEPLLVQNLEIKVHIPSIVQPSKLELKPFPNHEICISWKL